MVGEVQHHRKFILGESQGIRSDYSGCNNNFETSQIFLSDLIKKGHGARGER